MNWCKTIGSALLALFPLTIALPVAASVAPNSRPDIRSEAFYIFDESNSAVLAARHERTAVPIASITKLMTALVVLEANQPMDQVLTITADDVRGTVGSGSQTRTGCQAEPGRPAAPRIDVVRESRRACHMPRLSGRQGGVCEGNEPEGSGTRHVHGAFHRAHWSVESQRRECRRPVEARARGCRKSDDQQLFDRSSPHGGRQSTAAGIQEYATCSSTSRTGRWMSRRPDTSTKRAAAS